MDKKELVSIDGVVLRRYTSYITICFSPLPSKTESDQTFSHLHA